MHPILLANSPGQNPCGKICSHHGARLDKNRILVLSYSTITHNTTRSYRLVVISPAVSRLLFWHALTTRAEGRLPGLTRDGRARRALPLEAPDAALAQVLHQVRPERDEADASGVPRRRVDDPVAAGLGPQPTGEGLTGGIGDGRIVAQARLRDAAAGTEGVEEADEVGEQLGVVGDVLEAADGLELAGQVVGHLAERGVGVEPAVPGTAAFVVEAVAPRSGMREGGVDERVTGAAEHELTGVEVGEARVLGPQPSVRDALEGGEILERAVARRERQEDRALQASGRDQADGVALGEVDRRRQR